MASPVRPLFPSHNLAILSGALSTAPTSRVLPSGDTVVQLELTTRPPGGSTASVPVVAAATLTAKLDLEAGTEVVVIGEVRRRFFRSGGSLQSRTEVVATAVIPARRVASATRAVDRAVALLAGE